MHAPSKIRMPDESMNAASQQKVKSMGEQTATVSSLRLPDFLSAPDVSGVRSSEIKIPKNDKAPSDIKNPITSSVTQASVIRSDAPVSESNRQASMLTVPDFLTGTSNIDGSEIGASDKKVGHLSMANTQRARLDGRRYEEVVIARGLGVDTATNIGIIMGLGGDNVLNYGDDAIQIMTEIQDELMKVERFDEVDSERLMKIISPGFIERMIGGDPAARVSEAKVLLEKLEGNPVPSQCRDTVRVLERRFLRAQNIIKATQVLMPLIEEMEDDDGLKMQAKLRADFMAGASLRMETVKEQIKACDLYGLSVTKAIQSIRQLVTDWMQMINAKKMPDNKALVEKMREALQAVHG